MTAHWLEKQGLRQPFLGLCLFGSFFASQAKAESMVAPPAAQPADVEFNPGFLRTGKNGPAIDLQQFAKGNPVVPGSYFVDIVLNNIWFGRRNIDIRADSQGQALACLPTGLLTELGLDFSALPDQAAVARIKQDVCPALPALVPAATVDFDSAQQRLNISIPQLYLRTKARGAVDPSTWDAGEPLAGFLSYNANAYRTSGGTNNSTQYFLGTNAGLNLDDWRFRYNGSMMAQSSGGQQIQSLSTTVQRDITSLKSQLTLGDSFSPSDMFDSVSYRGVQLSSDDRMLPDSESGFAPVIRGLANTNARVTVRQNGSVVYETSVPPGPFKISDLYNTGYSGNLEVSVTESDGRIQKFIVPYAAVAQMLRPGLGRFALLAGQLRDNNTMQPVRFGMASYQRGINNDLSLYGGTELARGFQAVVLGSAVNTPLGALALDITYSQASQMNSQYAGAPSLDGQSYRLSYSKLLSASQTRLSVSAYRYASAGYLTLADYSQILGGTATLNRPRSQLQVNIDQPISDTLGRVFLSGISQNYWNQSGSNISYQAGYTNNYRWGNLLLSVSRTLNTQSTAVTQYGLTVNIPLGHAASTSQLSMNLTQDDQKNSQAQTTVNGMLNQAQTLSYSAYAGHSQGQDSRSSSGGANLQYTGPKVNLSGGASVSGTTEQQSLAASGALVFHPGGMTAAQTLGDAFAIVEAPGASGAIVSNTRGEVIDANGFAIVPNLVPYRLNEVVLDPKGMARNVDLDSSEMNTAPRSGAIVRLKFDTTKGLPVLVHLQHANRQAIPVGAMIKDGAGQLIGFVGQGSIAFLRAQQDQQLTVIWGSEADSQCSFRYSLPTGDKSINGFIRLEQTCQPVVVPPATGQADHQ